LDFDGWGQLARARARSKAPLLNPPLRYAQGRRQQQQQQQQAQQQQQQQQQQDQDQDQDQDGSQLALG
jgi:hypothetical protein